MEKGVIKIWLFRDGWMADFEGNEEVRALFGTTVIPTAYTARMTREEVIKELTALNPDYRVI
jgi:hypothetical protein